MREYMDCFALNHAKMPGLDPEVAMHKINIAKDVMPVKQGQRRTNPSIMDKIKKEVQ